MNKNLVVRIIFGLLGIAIIFGGIQISKSISSKKVPPSKRTSESPRVVPAKILYVQNKTVSDTMLIQGTLTAFDKIQIFSEVTGVLEETSRPFKVGSYFKKGDMLARINKEEVELSLLAQKSALQNAITQFMPDLKIDYKESFKQWQQYLNEFDVDAPLQPFPEPINDQEKYFIASKNVNNQYFNIKSAEARLEKYEIFAPFNGVITEVNINSGAVVRVGQSLGQLMNKSNFELEATVPLSDLKYLKVGNSVELYSDDIEGQWNGKIKRISDQIDPSTQAVKIFVSVSGGNLREGMYLKGDVKARGFEHAMRIPRELLINQKAVYVVRDSSLSLEEVEVIKITPTAAVVRGLKNGTPLLRNKIAGAFDGMKVKVEEQAKMISDSNNASDAAPNS